MAFKKRDENGAYDPKINLKGRPPVDKENAPTRREIREKEFLSILRKIKPHLSESIMTAAKIMKNQEASHQNQLKAAVILLNAYKELTNEVYDGEDADLEGTEVQPNNPAAVFSLKVINTD